MVDANGEFVNGFVERLADGEYGGTLVVEGINLSPIQGKYFKRDSDIYLWLKRRPLLEYDRRAEKYSQREREPRFEAYLKKQPHDNVLAYVGETFFMRFKFRIVGIYDRITGVDKGRLNLYVERLPMSEQTIINKINERKK